MKGKFALLKNEKQDFSHYNDESLVFIYKNKKQAFIVNCV